MLDSQQKQRKQRRKKRLALILTGLALLCAFLYLYRWHVISQAVVLTYHSLAEQPLSDNESLSVRPEDFAAQVDLLREEGYRFLFATEPDQAGGGPAVIITFDDGYEDNYTTLFPLLRSKEVKATIFVATYLIGQPGYLSAEQLREMADSGWVSIQSHTARHAHLGQWSREEVRRDYVEARRELEAITGQPVEAVAYPFGEASLATAILAMDCYRWGYITESRGLPLLDHRIPRATVNRSTSMEEFREMLE